MSKIQIRRDIAANWTSTDPTLSLGEMGFETDTNRFKIGDGVTAWTAQAYVHPSASYCDLRPISASHSSNQTKIITFTEAVDTDGYFEVGTPSRIFAPWTGLYFVQASIMYYPSVLQFYLESAININRAGAASLSSDVPMSRIAQSLQEISIWSGTATANTYVSLTAGDYIELAVFQLGSRKRINEVYGGLQMRFVSL